MAVVGAHQGDARILVEAQKALVDNDLTADAVVLELQIEAVRAKDVPQLQGPGLGGGVVAGGQPLGDLPGQTGGEGDEPAAVGAQQVHVHPGLDVEALCEAHADHVAEVAVPLLVPAQEDQMAALRVQLVDLVKAGPAGGRDVHLAADDGLDALPLAGPVEVDGAVHDPVVRDGHGGLAQLPDPAGQPVDPAKAVQQAVLRMDMEVDKRHRGDLSFSLLGASLEPVFIAGECWMGEDFSRQTRRFSAAILTYGKGNRRSMTGKRPDRQCSTVVNTGSYCRLSSTSLRSRCWRQLFVTGGSNSSASSRRVSSG